MRSFSVQTLPSGRPRQLLEAFEEAFADADQDEAFRLLKALEASLQGDRAGMHQAFALDLLVDCHRRLLDLRHRNQDEPPPVAKRHDSWSEVDFINRQAERAWHRIHGRPGIYAAA